MNKKQLNLIIDELEKVDNLEEESFLGLFYENHEYAYVKANKKGMIKLIIELIKTLTFFDFHLSRKEGHYSVIPIKSYQWFYKNNHINFDYIEPKKESREEIISQLNEDFNRKNRSNFKDKFFNLFGIIVLIFLIISLLVGIFQVMKWLILSVI